MRPWKRQASTSATCRISGTYHRLTQLATMALSRPAHAGALGFCQDTRCAGPARPRQRIGRSLFRYERASQKHALLTKRPTKPWRRTAWPPSHVRSNALTSAYLAPKPWRTNSCRGGPSLLITWRCIVVCNWRRPILLLRLLLPSSSPCLARRCEARALRGRAPFSCPSPTYSRL